MCAPTSSRSSSSRWRDGVPDAVPDVVGRTGIPAKASTPPLARFDELHVGEVLIGRIADDLPLVVLGLPQNSSIDEFDECSMSRRTSHPMLSRYRIDGHDRFLGEPFEDFEDDGAGTRLGRRLSDLASILDEVRPDRLVQCVDVLAQ